MYKPRFRSNDFGQMGQESDDVMLDLCLDLIDASDVELCSVAFSQIFFAASFGMVPSSAMASAA